MNMWEPGYEDSHRQWREEQDEWWQHVEEREIRRLEIEAAAVDVAGTAAQGEVRQG